MGLCRGLSLPTVTVPGAYGDCRGPSSLLSCLAQQSHHRAGVWMLLTSPGWGVPVGLLGVGREGRLPAAWALGLLGPAFPRLALGAGWVQGL